MATLQSTSISGSLVVSGSTVDFSNAPAASSWNMADNELIRPKLRDYSSTIHAIPSTATQSIDLSVANVFEATAISGSGTLFLFENAPPSGSAGSFVLYLTSGSTSTVDFNSPNSTTLWSGGTAPTLTLLDKLGFITYDSSVWTGSHLISDIG